ncbi:hypothetical protein ACH4T9_12315 [Micromonospora sp. NPDC020750]|uniref:hypothetical protein n=1 Tax=unclassified Micromonospora TaxID=2617518 RepID=UPI003789DA7C
MARAFYRGYQSTRVTRLHVMREDGKFPGRSAECGVHGWGVRRSEPVILDPIPAVPPAGLSWCPGCVGKLAERAGVLARWAAELAGSR